MIHFHRTVHHHILTEISSVLSRNEPGASEDSPERMTAGESGESRPTQPETTSHFRTGFAALPNLMDQVADGDGNFLETDFPADQGGGSRGS